jgi:sulfur carrier protein
MIPEEVPLQVQLNGERREFLPQHLLLSELIQELSLVPQRIAVEVNKQIVRRDEWERTEIKEGDQIEIVHFVGGG